LGGKTWKNIDMDPEELFPGDIKFQELILAKDESLHVPNA